MNSSSSPHAYLRVVVVLEAEEVLALDEALPTTVVALDVAVEEALTDVESVALLVLETDGPDADDPENPAVVVPTDPKVDDPDAPTVAEPDDPEDPVLAVFQ